MANELSLVLLLLVVIVGPIAAIAFARSGKAYDEIGKGRFAVDFDDDREADHHEEVRQLVEAKAYRQMQRGEKPVDVESELERLVNGGGGPAEPESPEPQSARAPADSETSQIRAEIREVVIAKNERRERQGEPPLDVEAEVERMMAELGSL